jgi:hypothetical protein
MLARAIMVTAASETADGWIWLARGEVKTADLNRRLDANPCSQPTLRFSADVFPRFSISS